VAAVRSIRAGASAVAVIVLIVAALALAKALHVQFPTPGGSSCLVHGDKFDVPLDSAQAGIAATIAGVATHRSMPVRAVAIAYAAALQESDLQNLSYGDLDSVGVFQQRPSEGWGSRRQLLNPVYASARFFAALTAVPRYQRLPIYRAAQEVQHSADGRAYDQYAGQGAAMASGFSGRRPRAVWCWYGAPIRGRGRLTAAEAELRTTFGRLAIRHAGDPLAEVKVRSVAAGWAVAAWLVSHASSFKLRHVSYQGYQWTAAHGRKGWVAVPRSARHTAARNTAARPTGARRGVTFG